MCNPVGVVMSFLRLPRVARIRATLGCDMKPRWGNVARMRANFLECGGEERVTALDFFRAKDVLFTKQIQTSPEIILKGNTPRFIDEWQLAPPIWNAVRHEVDKRRATEQFILAGSAAPTADITHHTGAGRIGRVTMHPLSLTESMDSTRQVDIQKLFCENNPKVAGFGGLSLEQYIQKIIVGGWPGLVGKTERQAHIYLTNYLDDISRVNVGSEILIPNFP